MMNFIIRFCALQHTKKIGLLYLHYVFSLEIILLWTRKTFGPKTRRSLFNIVIIIIIYSLNFH